MQSARVIRSQALNCRVCPSAVGAAATVRKAPPRFVTSYSTAHEHQQVWGPPDALSAEDRFAIMDLCHRFDHAINAGHQATMGQFFTADAEVHHPKGVVKGVDGLVAYFKACEPLARGSRHLTCNVVIEAAADGGREARALAYRLLHRAASPPTLLASGTIEDELVKSADGRWRFAKREFRMDPPAAVPAP